MCRTNCCCMQCVAPNPMNRWTTLQRHAICGYCVCRGFAVSTVSNLRRRYISLDDSVTGCTALHLPRSVTSAIQKTQVTSRSAVVHETATHLVGGPVSRQLSRRGKFFMGGTSGHPWSVWLRSRRHYCGAAPVSQWPTITRWRQTNERIICVINISKHKQT